MLEFGIGPPLGPGTPGLASFGNRQGKKIKSFFFGIQVHNLKNNKHSHISLHIFFAIYLFNLQFRATQSKSE